MLNKKKLALLHRNTIYDSTALEIAWEYINILLNDTFNTFNFWLYGVGHMAKDQSDSERGNALPSFSLTTNYIRFNVQVVIAHVCHGR